MAVPLVQAQTYSSVAPMPVCQIDGIIKSIEFKEAYDNPCLSDPLGCPSDTELHYPSKYFLKINIGSSVYVSGNIDISTCQDLYPSGFLKEIFINQDKVNSGDALSINQQISGVVKFARGPYFDSYSVKMKETASELQQLIQTLQTQIQTLTQQINANQNQPANNQPVASYNFTRDLTVGSKGEDVLALQKFLNNKGFTIATTGPGAPGNESNYFGNLTKSALAAYQAANGISPAVGYFGPLTRQVVKGTNAVEPVPVPLPQIFPASVSFETIYHRSSGDRSADAYRKVITNKADFWEVWSEVYGNIDPTPDLPNVDFSDEMVIAVSAGPKPNGCYGIAIASVVEYEDKVNVLFKESGPNPGDVCTLATVNPVHVIKLKRINKKVDFVDIVPLNFEITQPEMGDNWKNGETRTIKWSAPFDDSQKYNLYISSVVSDCSNCGAPAYNFSVQYSDISGTEYSWVVDTRFRRNSQVVGLEYNPGTYYGEVAIQICTNEKPYTAEFPSRKCTDKVKVDVAQQVGYP